MRMNTTDETLASSSNEYYTFVVTHYCNKYYALHTSCEFVCRSLRENNREICYFLFPKNLHFPLVSFFY